MSTEIKKEQGHLRKNWAFYSLLLVSIIALSSIWISKSMKIRKQTKTFNTEKSVILEKAQKSLTDNSAEHLRLMMKTFVWAVRGELIRGNQEQVDQYFSQLVKTDKIEEIVLVDKTGKIILSTNKKKEGSKLGTEYPSDILAVEETIIMTKDSIQIAAAPVMSIDSRLGTLILSYEADLFKLDSDTIQID